MKNIISQLDKFFESRIRLGIMSVLMVEDRVDFNTLKKMLAVSDGNLASHLKALEEKKYISVKKKFIGKKPNTTYETTGAGKKAFQAHLDALENFLKNKDTKQ